MKIALRRVPRLSFRLVADVSRSRGFFGVGLTWGAAFDTVAIGLTVGVFTFSAVWLRGRRGLVPAILARRDLFSSAVAVGSLLAVICFALAALLAACSSPAHRVNDLLARCATDPQWRSSASVREACDRLSAEVAGGEGCGEPCRPSRQQIERAANELESAAREVPSP